MLNWDGKENGTKINRCNSQKNKLQVQDTFFCNQQKNKLAHAAVAFYLSLPLFCTTTMLSCRTKMSNFLVTTYFYGFVEELSCVLTRYFVSCVHVRFYFSRTAAHFHLAGRQHYFSFSHLRFEFSCFSSYKIHLFCFQSLALALSLLST